MTSFEKKCQILNEVFTENSENEELQEFVKYNDLGLPLSFLISSLGVDFTDKAVELIDETYESLLTELGIQDVTYDYDNYEEMLDMYLIIQEEGK